MTSKFIPLGAIAALGLATLAQAATDLDTNGDGVLTMDEVQIAYPDMTEDNFIAMDVNADGTLDDEEVAAAQEAGVMPSQDG
jgi:hypothetical protein